MTDEIRKNEAIKAALDILRIPLNEETILYQALNDIWYLGYAEGYNEGECVGLNIDLVRLPSTSP